MKDWNLLKEKEIIDLIIGDSIAYEDMLFEYHMPYMSGSDICKLGSELGLEKDYWESEKTSRKKYMQDLLDYIISNNKVSIFFKKILLLKRFKELLKDNYHRKSGEIYYELIHSFMNKINEILFFDKCHIEYNLETWQFNLIDDEDEIRIESKSLDKIDSQYVRQIKNKIEKAIKDGDYESVTTKSRQLLEEIMIYGIELKAEEENAKGNINKLYQKFKSLYNMHQNNEMDNRINSLLSGLEKIVNSISEMRDVSSDSHGAGKKRIMLKEYHATLIGNAAVTMAEFLLSVVENNIGQIGF